jgi:hypothetical protein
LNSVLAAGRKAQRGGEAAGAKQKPRFLLCDLITSNEAYA